MKKILLLLSCLVAVGIGVSVAARHAYLLPTYGSVLNLLFPPHDLWVPLASAPVQKGVRRYGFTVRHKYPGKHEVTISIRRHPGMAHFPGDLRVTLEIQEGGGRRMKRSGSGTAFWGSKRQGDAFCTYSFPRDVGARGNVVCTVLIDGDSDALVERYGDVKIEISKAPDE
jgi:hypothetical protein